MPCVLVIEDDASVQQLLAAYLQLEGFQVTTADNGIEGLKRMKQSRPCLILLDLMMPIMDGEQFRAAQLREPGLADVPDICISAIYDARQRAERMQAAGLIKKPFDIEEVLSAVRARCQPAAAAAEVRAAQ
jgi:DNA-binding response OmpR family regulator